MRPSSVLDGDALRANAAAFRALGAPVAAVVKDDGYGWGARRLARELDGAVESYVVADDDELAALRPATAKPIRLLADAPPGRLGRILELGGIPNVSSRAAVAEAGAEAERRGGLTVRVGILDASGWAAVAPGAAADLARAFAGRPLAVELWTHVTAPGREREILEGLEAAAAVFAAEGVLVAGRDAASTASAGRVPPLDRLRIGAGLFGARLGSPVALRCAVRLTAPVVRRYEPGSAPRWAGYGEVPILSDHRHVTVLRCGYGDGFPKALAGSADILAVGMQYTTRAGASAGDTCVLIGGDDDLDLVAAQAGITPHELLIGVAPRP